ncbi:MAG: penicillin-binding protein activator LpoB [Proteobacteria bacterium]|nr:penicillin-binding protein activator LpoB [Pseudomonadota bacterium]NDC24140.1 penicillin-binding protein activator LpoB [Pseudomonadota bacterium]NDD04182.1 penicillin-binding protein activator LpoB [Pseudomonadota bacterium]NDG26702.1 penicillin-binding protein activator LpoB [Pseudomonadota bacterium]
MTQKQILKLVFCGVLTLVVSSCGSKQFTQGKYDDLSEDRLLDDKFNESDMRQIADTMVKSLTDSRVVQEAARPPVVLITLITNRASEHIDMKSMTDKIRTAVVKSGKFRFTEKGAREEMAGELQYQNESGYVDAASARKKGKQIGAQYFLTGEIADRVQEVGSKKYVYYKATFNLVNIETGIIDWTDEKEIRKFYQKRSTGL